MTSDLQVRDARPEDLDAITHRQRQGIGRALVDHVSRVLRSEGTEKIYLLTGPNTEAAAFYEALGFYTSRSRVVMGFVLTA